FIDLDNDLVLWMTFDAINATGDPTDLSSYGNNGTKAGQANQTQAGKFGKGFDFDGDGDYVNMGSNAVIAHEDKFTISLWFKTDSPLSKSEMLWGEGGSSLEFNTIWLNLNTKDIHYAYGAGSDIIDSDIIGNDGNWHHVAVVKDGSSYYEMFVDGTSAGTYESAVTAPSIDDSRIGSLKYGGTNFYFNGSIDDVLVFNRSLSAEEIRSLYNSSAPKYGYEHNLTGLSDGMHKFTAHVVDSAGSRNQTSTRWVRTDATIPDVYFTSPTPENGTYEQNYIYVNLSTSDTHDHYSFVDFNRSLIGWWRFEDAANDELKLHNGSVTSATQTENGSFGKAYSFEQANIAVSGLNLPSPPNLTVNLWVRRTGSTPSGQTLFADGGQSTSSGFLWLYFSGGSNMYYQYANGTNYYSPNAGSVAIDGNWHMVTTVADYTGRNLTTYVDGSRVRSITMNQNPIPPDSSTIYFGRYNPSHSYALNGSLDEIMIFNRTLTPKEIDHLYNSTLSQLEHNFTGLSDAKYTVKGYSVDIAGNMNQTETREITVEKDTPDVTICRDLWQANTYYNLRNDISTSGDCMNITASNVTFDMNGYTITGSGAGTGVEAYDNCTIKDGAVNSFETRGIYSMTRENIWIKNMSLDSNGRNIFLRSLSHYAHIEDVQATGATDSHSIWLQGSHSVVKDTVSSGNTYSGFYTTGSNNTYSNVTANSNVRGIWIWAGDDNKVHGLKADSNTYGIELREGANHTVITDSKITNSGTNDVYLHNSAINNTFLNVTYSSENVDGSSQLTRRWRIKINATREDGSSVGRANLTVYNSSGITTHSFFIEGNYTEAVGTDGMVSYWKMEDGVHGATQPIQDSVGNNAGTTRGEPVCNIAGYLGKGCAFDGGADEYIDVGDSASLDITDAITISAWVR
ncbi:MAG: hypothetical protein DRO99_05315, partial [Candidatus Aenigmatarchaeota archaeon]